MGLAKLADMSEPTAPAYFLGGKVNVCLCHKFRSNSKNNVCRCEHFLVIFQPILGHLDSVKLTSLIFTTYILCINSGIQNLDTQHLNG